MNQKGAPMTVIVGRPRVRQKRGTFGGKRETIRMVFRKERRKKRRAELLPDPPLDLKAAF